MRLVKCGLKCELALSQAEALDNAKEVLNDIIEDLEVYEIQNSNMCDKERDDFNFVHELATNAISALADFVLECTIED